MDKKSLRAALALARRDWMVLRRYGLNGRAPRLDEVLDVLGRWRAFPGPQSNREAELVASAWLAYRAEKAQP